MVGLLLGGTAGFLVGKSVGPRGHQSEDPEIADMRAIPLKTYVETAPGRPMTFTLLCQLSDAYDHEFAHAKESHYSVRMVEPGTLDSIHGYVLKTSPVGQRVLEALKDGKEHLHAVGVQNAGESSRHVLITRFDP